MEHRWGRRVSIDAAVRIQWPLGGRAAAITAGRLRDLSVSGAFLETDQRIPALARVSVKLAVAAQGRVQTYVISGFVMRRDERGIGVEWAELAPPGVGALLQARTLHDSDTAGQNVWQHGSGPAGPDRAVHL